MKFYPPLEMLDTDLYITCINLTGRRTLVVGAGRVAQEKIEGLLTCGAHVIVVAPDARPAIRELVASGAVEWIQRGYETRDLDGCLLVVAATADTSLHERIYKDAQDRSMLVNVVDVPDLCNFILPAIMRDGPIAVAISTAGASPALAKRMKREAAEIFGPAYRSLAEMLDEVRDWARSTLPTYDDRKGFFEDIVNGDPDPIALLAGGRKDEVKTLIEEAKRRAAAR